MRRVLKYVTSGKRRTDKYNVKKQAVNYAGFFKSDKAREGERSGAYIGMRASDLLRSNEV